MEDQKGQTLVEMIVIIGIVVLLATGVVAGTTVSLSRSETSEIRSDAVSYAQSGIELARSLRDAGWDAFAAMGTPVSTYCVGSDGTFGQPPCTALTIDGRFARAVTLELTTVLGIPTMKVTSMVSWGDTSSPANAVELTTYLTQWQ
jgi:type II secretory pathway pseudopilin PulG